MQKKKIYLQHFFTSNVIFVSINVTECSDNDNLDSLIEQNCLGQNIQVTELIQISLLEPFVQA